MRRVNRLLEYPIYVLENTEYWEAKRNFKFASSTFSVWSMIAVKQGRFEYSIDSVNGEATAGDVVLVPPNIEFKRRVVEPLSFFIFRHVYSDVSAPNEVRIIRFLKENGYSFRTMEQDRLQNNYRQLQNLWEQNNKLNHKWITHYVCDIWLLCYSKLNMEKQAEETSQDALVQAVKTWIEREAEYPIKLQNLAEHFGLHPVQLTRRFQKAYGISPSRYIHTIRIERAKSLLIETDYTIDHIAQLCGYQNGFYFSRIFTRYTDMNPSTFRKLHTLYTL